MSARYAGVREAYFSSNKPPPIPPKQANEYNTSAASPSGGGRRHFSPSSSPSHPRTHSSGSPSHYSHYSHSIPRSRSRPRPDHVSTTGKSADRSVGRSISFCHPTSPEAPPTLPPRPAAAIQKTFKRLQPKFLTGDLSFEDLIKHYQKSFPLRVYITNGYLGATSRLTISTGDMYNIHFLKRTKVMLFKDSHDTPYSIPLNSAIEFGLLYRPKQGRKPSEIETGVIFSSITDLLSQPETPRVVVVLKSWQSSDGKTSVVTNEVLFVKGMQRSLFGKKGVKVFSQTTKSDKFLSEECSTHFSTQPSLCRLHITDIMDHIKQPKGEKCILFLNSQVLMNRETSSSVQTIPDDLFDKVLTIVDQVTETSLIASSLLHRRPEVSAEDFDPDRDVLFDIPVDENTAEMTCVVVDMPDSSDTHRLYDDTKSLYEKFDLTKVMSIKDTGSETSHAAQKLLYTTIRRGCEGLGVEIDRPEAVYDTIPSHMKHQQATTPPSSSSSSSTGSLHPPPPPPTPPSLPNTMSCQQTNTGSPTRVPESTDNAEVSDGSSLEYDEVTPESLQLSHQSQMPNLHTISVTRGQRHQEEERLEKKIEQLQTELTESTAEVGRLHSKLERSEDRAGRLEGELTKMRSTVDKLLPQVYALQSKMTHFNSSQRETPAAAGKEEEEEEGKKEKGDGAKENGVDEKEVMEQNKKFLRNLSSHEVCELLTVMELGQYKEAFSRESVSGEILADCDNEILQTDLGVASRLHRLRLMKVVTGRHSAAALIEGADPYVTLGKK